MQISRIGPFALEEPLGRAALSNVLRGVHVDRRLIVAVKLLPRSILTRAIGSSTFLADVKILQKLDHPAIVRIFGGAIEQGQPYLVMELVDGESLREQLDRRGRLPWDAAVELADSICHALEEAHAQGIVHQRLTPRRVMLPRAGGAKLIGFDCVWADRDEVLGLRVAMEVAHYLAPEQFRGKPSASLPPSDLFSLGVILYESLTGELPWQADTPASLIQARRAGPAPRVSARVLDCPVWLDLLVSCLLAVHRRDRFTTAEEARRALADAQRKMAVGMGAAQQAWSGRRGVLTVDTDRSEVRRLRRQQQHDSQHRSPTGGPFYERIWFLVLCLVVLVGAGIWALLPPGEEALFAKARPLMESDDPSDWHRAKQQYLDSFEARFPASPHAQQIEQFEQRFAMHRAETRCRNNERLGRPARSEAESRFAEANRYERFGDRLTAWQKYEALVLLFKSSEDPMDRAFVGLARRQIGRIQATQGAKLESRRFVEEKLAQVQALLEADNLLEARRLLQGIVSLYGGNRELKPLVEQARQVMRKLDG